MKGERKIIDALNGVLKNELGAINQYFLHARVFRNWGLEKLNGFHYRRSIEVMKEADAVIERILFLEALPQVQSPGRLLIGGNVVDCLAGDLQRERETHRPSLLEAIALCEEERDYVSRDLLRKFLASAEATIDWLETQHNLIDDLGLPNYLQAQIDDDE